MSESDLPHADLWVYGDESGLTFYGFHAGLSAHGLGLRIPGRTGHAASGDCAGGGSGRRGAGVLAVPGVSGVSGCAYP